MRSNDPKKNEIVVAVMVAGKVYGIGVGSTRKKAEQVACKEALSKVGVSVGGA
jgi:dsRNA-specific ribonuclease